MNTFQTIQRKFVLAIILFLTMLVMQGTAFSEQFTENECWNIDHCEIVVDRFNVIIKEHDKNSEKLKLLYDVCLKLPSELACICRTITDSHGMQVIEKLRERLYPREICMRIEHGML